MFGDNTPPFKFRHWAENQLKISQIALDENQLKKYQLLLSNAE